MKNKGRHLLWIIPLVLILILLPVSSFLLQKPMIKTSSEFITGNNIPSSGWTKCKDMGYIDDERIVLRDDVYSGDNIVVQKDTYKYLRLFGERFCFNRASVDVGTFNQICSSIRDCQQTFCDFSEFSEKECCIEGMGCKAINTLNTDI